MSSDRGLLLVLSGPSGVGKSTVARDLIENFGYTSSVSATTRTPRPGEVEGRDYFFLDAKTFDQWEREGRFLETASVHGQKYGTPIDFVNQAIGRGQVVILVIDVQGAAAVRRRRDLPQFQIFLDPPSPEILEERLRGRKTDSEEVIQRRLLRARQEMAHRGDYDAVLTNDALKPTVARLQAMIEELRRGRNPVGCDGQHCRV